jgi:thymidylate synthase (FAD)
MKIITPSVKLEHHTPQGLIATAARASYQSYDNRKLTDERLIQHFVADMESPLEFAWAMVSVTCSYAAHVHFLRHRHGSFSFLSSRYTEGLGVILPPDLAEDERAGFLASFAEQERLYLGMRERGVRRQDARYAMPQSTAVQGWLAGNARFWLHMLALRTAKKAMPEVRTVAGMIQAELSAVWPLLLPETK